MAETIKVYVAGPIGTSTDFPERFAAGELEVAALGYTPVSPLNNGLPRNAEWTEHMKADIRLLLQCNGAYFLRNWFDSRGARIEHTIAAGLNMLVLYQPDLDAPN